MLLALIVCAAAALRLWQLDDVPPGLTHDEAAHGQDAIAIVDGARPIYQTVGYGREPLYDYVLAGGLLIGDPSRVTLRVCSVALGLTALLATYGWVRIAFDAPTALLAVAFQAASFWSLSTSRQILRSSLLPALLTGAVFFFWSAIPFGDSEHCDNDDSRVRFWALGLFALLIGAALYTYLPARGTWVMFPFFLIYLRLAHRPLFRRVWAPVLVAVLAGLLIAAPLFAYLWAHPGAEQRLTMVDAPLQAFAAGNVPAILAQAWSEIAGLFIPGWGDGFLAYNIPGRPTLAPWTGVLLLAGLALCAARWRRPQCAFALLWLLVGLSPSLLTGAVASSTRSIAALPVIFLFPAIAVVFSYRWAARRWGCRAARAVVAGAVVLVIATGAVAVRDYFGRWAQSPDVRAAYQKTVVAVAEYLDAQPSGGTVVLSTVYPGAPHDPYVFRLGLARQDISARWIDARRALLVPPDPVAVLVVPSSTPIDPYFISLPGLRHREEVWLRTTDLDPSFDVFDWQPRDSLAELRARSHDTPLDLELPVDFGGALHLRRLDLTTSRISPGEVVEIVTVWEVLDPGALRDPTSGDGLVELVLFTHALDAAGDIVAQEDRLDAPAWSWRAGDVVVQIHRFVLPDDYGSDRILLEVGAYRPHDLSRLPVLVGGEVVGDRVLVGPIEVEGKATS